MPATFPLDTLNSSDGDVLVKWLALADRLLQIDTWHNTLDATEHSLQRWIIAVTLLLLLGIVIALLST